MAKLRLTLGGIKTGSPEKVAADRNYGNSCPGMARHATKEFTVQLVDI